MDRMATQDLFVVDVWVACKHMLNANVLQPIEVTHITTSPHHDHTGHH
jgi:hypothetical protein